VANGLRVSMLVCGDHGRGRALRLRSWQAITEDQVIESSLADLDVWRAPPTCSIARARWWKVSSGLPRPMNLAVRHQAFLTEAGTPRPFYAARAYDGGVLLASNGGVSRGRRRSGLSRRTRGRDPCARARGKPDASGAPEDAAQRRTSASSRYGRNRIWKNGAFSVLDMHEW